MRGPYDAEPRQESNTARHGDEAADWFTSVMKGPDTVFVCQNYVCQQPVTDPAALSQQLISPGDFQL